MLLRARSSPASAHNMPASRYFGVEAFEGQIREHGRGAALQRDRLRRPEEARTSEHLQTEVGHRRRLLVDRTGIMTRNSGSMRGEHAARHPFTVTRGAGGRHGGPRRRPRTLCTTGVIGLYAYGASSFMRR